MSAGGQQEGASPAAEITIVIVAYETPEHLRRLLASLADDGVLGTLPVLVIDNSVSDACAAVAGGWRGVELVRNPRNVGYARAVNQGLAAARTPFVLILNPDIEVRPGAIARLRQAMEAQPEAGLAAARLLNPDGTLQQSCRRFYTLGTILLRRTFLGRLFPDHRLVREHLMSEWDHATVRNVDWVLGACLLVRRAAIDEVGPMDERFFLYFEDVDWCARMHKHGWHVLYVPDAVMVHHHRRDSARGGVLSPSARMHLASVVRFYEKWSLLLYLLKRNRSALRVVVLLAADLAALNAAFLLAFGTRKLLAAWFAKPLFAVADYWQFLLVDNLVSLLALRGSGLYRAGRPTTPPGLLVRVTPSLVIASLAVLVSTFLLNVQAYSRFVVVLNLPLAVAAVTGLRAALGRLRGRLAERGLAARRVLLIGARPLAEWMAERLRQVRGIRYEVVGIYDRSAPLLAAGPELGRRVRRLCHAERVSELVLADEHGELLPLFGELAELAGEEGVRVRLAGAFSRVLGPALSVEGMAGVPVLEPAGGAGGPAASGVKRGLDITVALLALLPAGPAALWVRAIAALGAGRVRATDAAGYTAAGAPAPRSRYETSGYAAGSERFLARVSELWQVLRGRLSLIGIHRYAAPPGRPVRACRAARAGLLVPPAAGGEVEKCLAADQSYVLGWSLATDLRLLLETLRRRQRE